MIKKRYSKRSPVPTTHVRIFKKDKALIDSLVRKGVYPNTAIAIHGFMTKRMRK